MKSLLLILMFLFVSSASASPINNSPLPIPYRAVGPIKEDAMRVIVFISFDCSHCRDALPSITRWGMSLPKNIKFELMPVATDDARYLVSTRAWYAALSTGATDSVMTSFANQAMDLNQQHGIDLTSPDLWHKAADNTGIKKLEAAWKSVPKSVVMRAMKKMHDYQIESTPSIAIGGRYVITPDNTNGDMDLFMRLASGLVSSIAQH